MDTNEKHYQIIHIKIELDHLSELINEIMYQ